MNDHDGPQDAAQQRHPEEANPVQRPIEEEKKEPEPSQTIQPASGYAMSVLSIDAPLRVKHQPIETVQQSADTNQATLQAIQQLSQQFQERIDKLEQKLEHKLEEKQREQKEELKEMRLDLHS